MSTLAVVEEILRETASPMSVREIVQRAGVRLPSKSKTPDTVVARDLAMDIKRQGNGSRFVRAAPGRYTLREIFMANGTGTFEAPESLATAALRHEHDAPLPAKRREFVSPPQLRVAEQVD